MGCLLRPPPIRLRGDGSPTARIASDGPVHHGRCSRCGKVSDDDMYRCQGVILCGDCRYYVRHGRWPNYSHTPQAPHVSADAVVAAHEKAFHGRRIDIGE
jgi:hypothetical protein